MHEAIGTLSCGLWPAFPAIRDRIVAIDRGQVVDDRLLGLMAAAIEAGDAIIDPGVRFDARVKADRTHITRADTMADDIIRCRLRANRAFAGCSYIDEESEDAIVRESTHTLVIDPVDGTTNLSLRIPFFGISLCLLEGKSPAVGVVYAPRTAEIYVARRGKGSYWADLSVDPSEVELVRLRVPRAMRRAREEHLERGLHAFCHGGGAAALDRMVRIYRAMKVRNPKYRQFGCASLELCYVAQGRILSFNMTGVNLWDVAAGSIVALEAGARVTDFDGEPFDKDSTDVLAADPGIHSLLLAFIKGCLA